MKTTLFSFLIPVTSLLMTLVQPSFADTPTMRLEDAWIAEAPPVSKVMVAYMTIHNTSDQEITIIRAESENYSSIEFHETRHEDGMARMIRHENMVIPANGSIKLTPGGRHLMLFNPVKTLKAGDTVNIQFTNSDQTNSNFSVTVEKARF